MITRQPDVIDLCSFTLLLTQNRQIVVQTVDMEQHCALAVSQRRNYCKQL